MKMLNKALLQRLAQATQLELFEECCRTYCAMEFAREFDVDAATLMEGRSNRTPLAMREKARALVAARAGR